MKKVLLLISFVFLSCLLFAQTANEKEISAVKKAIQDGYVDGLCNNFDMDAINKNIHPDFKIIGIGRDNSTWEYPINKWLEKVKENKKKGMKYSFVNEITTVKFLSVDVSGKVAVAKIEFYEGGKLNFIDYLTLFKFDDGWKIRSKVFNHVAQ